MGFIELSQRVAARLHRMHPLFGALLIIACQQVPAFPSRTVGDTASLDATTGETSTAEPLEASDASDDAAQVLPSFDVDSTAQAADGVFDAAGDLCAKSCDDGNPCTDDVCDPLKGCTSNGNNLCEPATMELVLTPAAATYKVGDAVKLSAKGADKVGHPIPTVAIDTVTIAPPDGATIIGQGLVFIADGKVEISATAAGFPNVKAWLTAVVDSSGPNVAITKPARGSAVSGKPAILVVGSASDAVSGVKSVTVNQKNVGLAADGSFSIAVEPIIGQNLIAWDALDAAGNKTSGVQTYQYSPIWILQPTGAPGQGAVAGGIGVWLGQKVIDNGQHAHAAPKDLAGVADLSLGGLDLAVLWAGAPVPVVGTVGPFTTSSVQVMNLKTGDPTYNDGFPSTTLTSKAGGLHVTAKFSKLSLTARLALSTTGKSGYQEFAVTADDLSVQVDLNFAPDPVTGQLVVTAKNSNVALTKALIALAANDLGPALAAQVSQSAGGLIALISSYLEGPFLNLATLALQPTLEQALGAPIAAALAGLVPPMDVQVGPSSGPAGKVKLARQTSLSGLDWVPGQGVAALFAANVSAPDAGKPKTSLGSLGIASCLQAETPFAFAPQQQYAIEVGYHTDVLNQIALAMWSSGLLNGTFAPSVAGIDLAPLGASDVQVECTLLQPPLLNPCVPGGLRLQLGDVQLHVKGKLSGTPIDAQLFFTAEATVDLKSQAGAKTGAALSLKLKSLETYVVEFAKVSAEASPALVAPLAETLAKDAFVPMAIAALNGALALATTPSVDLGGFPALVPAGSALAELVQQVTWAGGYTWLRGPVQ